MSATVIKWQPRSAKTAHADMQRQRIAGVCATMADQAPIIDAAGSDEPALDRLGGPEQQSLLRSYFSRQVATRQDVDDYVQDVYLRVLSAAPQEKIGNWRGFLLRVASSLMVDRFRRDQVRHRDQHQDLEQTGELVDDKAACPEQALICREELALLEDALKQVDPIARNVFLLVRVDGLRHREVADRLGLEVKTVSRHVERVLAHLGRTLGERAL